MSVYAVKSRHQTTNVNRRVARNPRWKGCFGGLGAKPPAAGGLGAKLPAAGGTGVMGAEPPALENFAFFAKITSF